MTTALPNSGAGGDMPVCGVGSYVWTERLILSCTWCLFRSDEIRISTLFNTVNLGFPAGNGNSLYSSILQFLFLAPVRARALWSARCSQPSRSTGRLRGNTCYRCMVAKDKPPMKTLNPSNCLFLDNADSQTTNTHSIEHGEKIMAVKGEIEDKPITSHEWHLGWCESRVGKRKRFLRLRWCFGDGR